MPKIKLKEETFPSLNQTGESFSLSLNLASSLACVCRPPTQTSTWYEEVSPTCVTSLTKSSWGQLMLMCNPALL